MQLEGLLYEAYDKADWSKFLPPLDQAGRRRLDEIQGLLARATGRLAKVRTLAKKAAAKEILAVLDGTDEKQAS